MANPGRLDEFRPPSTLSSISPSMNSTVNDSTFDDFPGLPPPPASGLIAVATPYTSSSSYAPPSPLQLHSPSRRICSYHDTIVVGTAGKEAAVGAAPSHSPRKDELRTLEIDSEHETFRSIALTDGAVRAQFLASSIKSLERFHTHPTKVTTNSTHGCYTLCCMRRLVRLLISMCRIACSFS